MGITEQWLERHLQTEISGLPIRIRPYDVTAILDSKGNVLNPLLGSIKKLIEGGTAPIEALQKGFLSSLDTLPALRTEVNGVLKKVLIEPDPEKFDVDHFTLVEKVSIFIFLIGGEEALAQAEIFRLEQGTSMGNSRKG